MLNIQPKKGFVNTFSQDFFENFYKKNLFSKPFCTDDLGIGSHSKKNKALKMRYVQHNNFNSIRWLVFDVDRSSSCYDWEDLHAPPPNFTVTSLENGHSHLFYALEVPIHKNFNSAQAPLMYTASVEYSIMLKLKSDPSYVGFLSKNPLNKNWFTQYFMPYLYTLDWLADYLDILANKKLSKEQKNIGLGRNCTLFDDVRLWSYSEIRRKNLFNNLVEWQNIVFHHTLECNLAYFKAPLHESECKAIAKSIAKWTYRRFSSEGFSQFQRKAAEKCNKIKKNTAEKRNNEIIEYYLVNNSVKYQDLANKFNVSLRTIKSLHLKKIVKNKQQILNFDG
jgi:hypothetical protein